MKLPVLNPKLQAFEKEFLHGEYYSLLQNVLLSLEVKWLSHPTSIYQAENKLYQLKTASNIHFSIPDTVITNSKDELRKFHADHPTGIVIKPLSSNKLLVGEEQRLIFTNKLDNAFIETLDSFDLTPCIYQEYIQKEYEVRVTVVGDRTFSARVMSQDTFETSVDWRRGKLPFLKYTLPTEVEEKCINLVKALSLSFGAIDLIRSRNGDYYYFLEVNPNGQWAWIETDTGLPISEAIVNFLSE